MPLVALWVIILGLLGYAAPAEAFVLDLDLNSSLDCSSSNQNLFAGKSGGGGSCTSDNFFTRAFCTFETTLGAVISALLCHLQSAWQGPVFAAIVLCMVLTGVAFTLGLLNFTLKEVAAFLFKITLVAAFALNSSLIMNIAYAFFINVTRNTVAAFARYVDAAPEFGPDHGSNMFESAGEGMNNFVGGTVFKSLLENPAIIGCGIFIPLFLIVLFYFIPGVFLLVLKALGQFFMVLARGLAGYFFSLTMITMLVACLPIFISFALFKLTREIFDDYLKQLGQSCLNIVVIFLFLAGVSMIDDEMFDFVGRMGELFRVEYRFRHNPAIVLFPVPYCSICKPKMVGYTDPDKQYLNGLNLKQLDPNTPCDGAGLLDWTDIIKEKEFINYLLLNTLSLYLLAVLFYKLLLEAPKFANQLGGQRYGYNVMGGGRKAEAMGSSPLAGGTVQQNFMKGIDDNIQDKTRLGLFATNINPFKDARSLWRGIKDPKQTLRNSPKTVLSALGKRSSIVTGAVAQGVNAVKYGSSKQTKAQRAQRRKWDQENLRRQEERLQKAQDKMAKVLHLEKKIKEMQAKGNQELAERQAKLQAELNAAQEEQNKLNRMEIAELKFELLESKREIEEATAPLKQKLEALRQSETPDQQKIAKLEKQITDITQKRQKEDEVLHKHLNKLEAERANFKKDEIKKLQDEMQELATKKQAHDKNLQYYQQVLGATQNKVAKEQGAMNVMKYDVKKYDKELTHSGGGLKDALYDPIHIDEKGQAKASSIKFATNPYKEKEAGYTDEEYRQEQRMYKTSWYVLMKP